MTDSSPSMVTRCGRGGQQKQQGSFTDHLANERTFLAWTRTGLGVFALGCAIAKFGGSDKSITSLKTNFEQLKPWISGLVLVTCGIGTIFYGIYRFSRINRQIRRRDVTEASQIREPVIATLVLILSLIAISIIFIIL